MNYVMKKNYGSKTRFLTIISFNKVLLNLLIVECTKWFNDFAQTMMLNMLLIMN